MKFEGWNISVSPLKGKKYRASRMVDGKLETVDFGAKGYGQYKDNALGVYKKLDHMDLTRRSNYHARHNVDNAVKFSANYFSYKLLW